MLRQVGVVVAVVVIVAALGGSTRPAMAQGCHGGGSMGGSHGSHGTTPERAEREYRGPVDQRGSRVASIREKSPHGGQVSMAGTVYFVEVVYEPLETRVYLYDALQQPISARGVHGRLLMRPHGSDRDYPIALAYVAPPADSPLGDYLAAAVDVRSIPDGEMTVTVELHGLPHRQYADATVEHEFALSRVPTAIKVAAVTDADHQAIARQAMCPVSGGRLGDHGTPVKLLIGSQTVYLCCRGCIDEVTKAPERFLGSGSLSQSHVH